MAGAHGWQGPGRRQAAADARSPCARTAQQYHTRTIARTRRQEETAPRGGTQHARLVCTRCKLLQTASCSRACLCSRCGVDMCVRVCACLADVPGYESPDRALVGDEERTAMAMALKKINESNTKKQAALW